MVKWISRYSDTMEDDKFGRWARIAFVGKGIYAVEIATIRKVTFPEYKFSFIVDFTFPRRGEILFKTLEEAKKQVEEDLEIFIKLCKTKN